MCRYTIFTKKLDFGNYPEMDSKYLQTSSFGPFVLMVLSHYRELHLICMQGFWTHPCDFLPEVFWNAQEVFSRTHEDCWLCQYCECQIILVKLAKHSCVEINTKSKFSIELSEVAIERVFLEKSSSRHFRNFDI